jgi:transcriptional regulator with XRE-family HTH domain
MDIRRSFGHALKVARKSAGLTQEDFSVVSSTNFVSLIENGKTSPTLQKLEAICSILGTHPVTLLTLTYMLDNESNLDLNDILHRVRSEVSKISGEWAPD